jgi:hypothetical protein
MVMVEGREGRRGEIKGREIKGEEEGREER